MAAGLGFKDFQTGEVLTAADVDGYLMQGIWVFASAAARDAAVTSPQEGNFAFLKDTNVTTYYTGSAWANLDTTGMTNPMTTTGDTIYSSSGSTPARLGIGTAGQVLQVNSGATAPEWATPAGGGGMTLISETVASSLSSLTFGTISGSYKQLVLIWSGVRHSTTGSGFGIRLNNNSGSVYSQVVGAQSTNTSQVEGTTAAQIGSDNYFPFGINANAGSLVVDSKGYLIIDNYASSTKAKTFYGQWNCFDNTGSVYRMTQSNIGTFNSKTAVTSIDVYRTAGSATFSNSGDTTIRLYGVA